MKTVIFGGTFNPPHLGHERMVEIVEKEICPDRFLIIPTYIPPHKEMAAGSPTPRQRLSLCRAAFSKYKFVSICDMELKRKGNSYTVDTLNELRTSGEYGELYFVIGSDSLVNFTRWYRFEEIFRLCTLAVIPREENDYEMLIRISGEYKERYGASVTVLHVDPLEISSTYVRNGGIGSDTVSEKVLRYIRKNHLYNT